MDESSIAIPSPCPDSPETASSVKAAALMDAAGTGDDSGSLAPDQFGVGFPKPMSPLSPLDQKVYLYGRPIRKYQVCVIDEVQGSV